MTTTTTTMPGAVWLIADAVILEDAIEARALWNGAPAMAYFFVGSDASLTVATVMALGQPGRSPFITPALYAGADNDNNSGAVVILEAAPGITIDELVMRVVEDGDGAFPVDVAFRLAIEIIEAGRMSPRFVAGGAHLVVTWDGRLRQLPLPFTPSDELRFVSPHEVRGLEAHADPVHGENALYRGGIVLYHLVAACAPFAVGGQRMEVLSEIVTAVRRPLLHAVDRGRVTIEQAEAVDGLIALPSIKDTSSSLEKFACAPDECRRFLSTWLAQNFAERRAEELTFWENAVMVQAGQALAPWRPMHRVPPAPSLRDAMRTLQNRATRVD